MTISKKNKTSKKEIFDILLLFLIKKEGALVVTGVKEIDERF